LFNMAKGVVRFEITLRHRAINSLLRIPNKSLNMLSQFDSSTCIQVMNKYLTRLLGITPETMSTSTVFEKFVKASPRMALRLYQFYRLYVSSDPTDKLALRDMPERTRSRYKKFLKEIAVGIPDDVSETNVSLSIPSEYSVGDFPRVW